jgi:hypothetical protein
MKDADTVSLKQIDANSTVRTCDLAPLAEGCGRRLRNGA